MAVARWGSWGVKAAGVSSSDFGWEGGSGDLVGRRIVRRSGRVHYAREGRARGVWLLEIHARHQAHQIHETK